MSLLHTFTPVALTGAGSDEWVVDAGLTMQSLGVTDIVFKEKDAEWNEDRYQIDQGEFVQQISGDETWATDAHKAGEARTFEFWAVSDFWQSGASPAALLGTGNLSLSEIGFMFLVGTQGVGDVLRLFIGDSGGTFISVESAFEVPTSELVHFGVAFEQTGGNLVSRFFINGEFEEDTTAYVGVATAATRSPVMWSLIAGTNFFDGQFYEARVYDHALSQAEVSSSFSNPPLACVSGGSGPLGSSSTLTRAYSAKDRLG